MRPMRRSKPYIPANRQQNRQVLLSQGTTSTEGTGQEDTEQKGDGTAAPSAQGYGQTVEPINRAMFPATTAKVPWDKFSFYVAVGVAVIGFIWYLAAQDSAVKNLTDDAKELKKKSEETTRFSIEAGIRLDNVEQRLSGIEQRERTVSRPTERSAQAPIARP